MSTKYKKFLSLTARHKRRRLSTIVVNRSVQERSSSTSDSDSDEISEIEPPQTPLNRAPSACVNDLQNRYVEHSCDTDEQTEPSHSNNEDIEDSEQDEEIEDDRDNRIVQDSEQENNSDRSTSFSEDEDINVHEPENLADVRKRVLRQAFITTNLSHKQGNILLKTLREFPFNLNHLPKDARTLLQTPTVVANRYVQQLAGGEYLHIGLRSTLTKKLDSLPDGMLPETVEIDFSTDGAQELETLAIIDDTYFIGFLYLTKRAQSIVLFNV